LQVLVWVGGGGGVGCLTGVGVGVGVGARCMMVIGGGVGLLTDAMLRSRPVAAMRPARI